MTDMFVTGMNVFVEVALRLEPPHEAEMILNDYRREVGQFAPASVLCRWTELGSGFRYCVEAEVSGRRTIKRGALARVKYKQDDNESIEHWPAYVQRAMHLAMDQVKR